MRLPAFIAGTLILLATVALASRQNHSVPLSIAQLEPTPTPVPIVQWFWDFGDPSTGPLNYSTEQHPSHRFSHAKTYSVMLTVWDANGQSDSITRYVTVRK